MKVHYASGTHPFDLPWLNVDYDVEADIKVDLLGWPWPQKISGVTDAYVGHFLEHLYPEEGVEFLRRVRMRALPGARLTVVGPDAVKGQQWFDEGRLPQELLDAIKAHGELFDHDPNNRGNVHLWDCTGDAVVEMLKEAGWSRAEELTWDQFPNDVPLINPAGWQFLAIAYADNIGSN